MALTPSYRWEEMEGEKGDEVKMVAKEWAWTEGFGYGDVLKEMILNEETETRKEVDRSQRCGLW